jgi:hypothetical protein
MIKLAFITLSIVSVAHADIDWSAWKHCEFGSAGPQILLRGDDSRFEFRWRSELSPNGPGCAIEIRPTVDGYKPPSIFEVLVVYFPKSHLRTPQIYAERGVTIRSRVARGAMMTLQSCGIVEAVISGKSM